MPNPKDGNVRVFRSESPSPATNIRPHDELGAPALHAAGRLPVGLTRALWRAFAQAREYLESFAVQEAIIDHLIILEGEE